MYSIVPQNAIKKTMERMRKVFAFETPDRLPVMFKVNENRTDMTDKFAVAEFSKHVYHNWKKEETEEDFERELKLLIENMNKRYEDFPYGDFMPGLEVKDFQVQEIFLLCLGVGYSINDDGTLVIDWFTEPLIRDVEKDIDRIKLVNYREEGLVSRLLKKMKYFADNSGHGISIGTFDMQSPLAHLMKLMKTDQFMLEFYDHPEEMKQLLYKLADLMIEVFHAQEEALGRSFTSVGIADDLVSVINPEIYMEIAAGPNTRIFKEFGGGMIHTCGPIWGKFLDAILSVEGCVNMNDIFIRADKSRTAADMLEIKKRIGGKMVYNTLLPLDLENFTVDFVKRLMEGGGVYLWDDGPKEVGLRIMDIVDRASA